MTSFFYFDLETTGTNPYYNDIIEIGLQTSDGKHSFSVLVNPNYDVSDTITYITGISNSLLQKEGIPLKDAILAMHAFIRKHAVGRNTWIVGHNVWGFDRIFYKRAIQTCGLRPPRPSIHWLDTLPLTKYCMPQMNSFKLISIAKYIQVAQTQSHRALGDCQLCALVLPHILSLFQKKCPFPKKSDPFSFINETIHMPSQ